MTPGPRTYLLEMGPDPNRKTTDPILDGSLNISASNDRKASNFR